MGAGAPGPLPPLVTGGYLWLTAAVDHFAGADFVGVFVDDS